MLNAGFRKRNRRGQLSPSEIMTILVWFHRSNYRTFKHFYQEYVCEALRQEFPNLVSYSRFIALIPGVCVPLCAYLMTRRGPCTGIAFVDATSLAVCHNRRIRSHKVFRHVAARGKTSVGWFYGFKLHLMINDRGDLLGFFVTAGNVDDRKPLPKMARDLFGKLFGDKGYISQQLFTDLLNQGVQLITKLRKNMKNRLMSVVDKVLLRKRSLIETVYDQLKNISQIEHTRHRSVTNYFMNLVAGLIAYTYQEQKPSLNLSPDDYRALYDAYQEAQPALIGAQTEPVLVV
jgi:hypothetical protein